MRCRLQKKDIVKLAPYKYFGRRFPICKIYETPFLNIPPADVAHLNEVCRSFKGFRLTKFPNIANGKTGALLSVNTFSYFYSIQVIEGNDCRPHGIQIRLGWTIAGEYHQIIAPTRMNTAIDKLRDLCSTFQKNQITL